MGVARDRLTAQRLAQTALGIIGVGQGQPGR